MRLDHRVGVDRPEPGQAHPDEHRHAVDPERLLEVLLEAEVRHEPPDRRADHGQRRDQHAEHDRHRRLEGTHARLVLRPERVAQRRGVAAAQADPHRDEQHLELLVVADRRDPRRVAEPDREAEVDLREEEARGERHDERQGEDGQALADDLDGRRRSPRRAASAVRCRLAEVLAALSGVLCVGSRGRSVSLGAGLSAVLRAPGGRGVRHGVRERIAPAREAILSGRCGG
jgi:hypothetical protein